MVNIPEIEINSFLNYTGILQKEKLFMTQFKSSESIYIRFVKIDPDLKNNLWYKSN